MLAALALAMAAGPDPAGLVERLGSDRFAERVDAARALEALGREALPALRAAQDAENPRVRSRARALIASLGRRREADRLNAPTLVRLDFRDRPLGDVLDELNARHDLHLAVQLHLADRIAPEGRRFRDFDPVADQPAAARVLDRRVTLESPAPVPFWEAIDRLCRAGGVQHDLHPWEGFGPRPGTFRLYPGRGGSGPSSDRGPIRVKVTGMHATRERDFTGSPRLPRLPYLRPAGRELDVKLAVLPEPGLLLRQVGEPKIAEAVDDRGRSLVPPPDPEYDPQALDQVLINHNQGVSGPVGFELAIPLLLLDPPGRSIARLRGSVPVVVLGRRPDPLVIPLAGAVGKPARNDAVTIVVHEVRPEAGRVGTVVDVSLRPNQPAPPLFGRQADPRRPDLVARLGPGGMEHLDPFDARGRELNWSFSQGTAHMGPGFQAPSLLMTIEPTPVELRYFEFIQEAREVPFDLRDLPMP